MKKTFFYCLLSSFAAVIIASCNYFPEDDETGQLVSYTAYDTTAHFNTYSSFVITDSIGYLQFNAEGQPVVVYKTRQNASIEAIVTNAVLDKLENYCGYERVSRSRITPPDLVVDILYVDVDKTVNYTDWWRGYNYWNNSSDYWYHAPYAPYYPSYSAGATSAYGKGTLIIDIKSLQDADYMHSGQLVYVSVPAVWVGAVSGVSLPDIQATQINEAIKTCFTQTPVLFKNN